MSVIPTLRPSDLCSACFFGDIARVKELLFVEPVEEDPPLEADDQFDPTSPADDEGDAEAAERQALRDQNEADITKKLHKEPSTVISRKTPVDFIESGLGIEILPATSTKRENVRAIFMPKSDPSSLLNKATPLHWACLAREHEIVAFLISLGADPDFVCKTNDGNGSATLGGVADETAVGEGNPFKISARQLCRYNRYFETLRVIEVASEKYKVEKDKVTSSKDQRLAILKKREELRQEAARKQREEEEIEAGGGQAGDADDNGGGYDDGNGDEDDEGDY